MSTAGEVAAVALKRILVYGADESPSPDDFADFFTAMNDYMAALEADGVRLGYTPVSNSSDEVTVPPGAIRGIIANVAIEVSPDYGGQVSQALIRQAESGLRTMRRLGAPKMQTSLPSTLPVGSANEWGSTPGQSFYGPEHSSLLSLAGNTRETEFSAADTLVILNAFWTVERSKGLRADITGRTTNTGPDEVDVTVKLDGKLTGNGTYTLSVMLSGVAQKTQALTLSATPSSAILSHTLTLPPGGYIEIHAECDTGTDSLVIQSGTLEVT